MENYKGYTYTITPDEYAESPREWDNIGTCIFRGKHSYLGDKHNMDFSECSSWEEDEKIIHKEYGKDCILLPVYAYIHSGMTIKTTPFSCRWDSGRLGSIVVSKEKIRKEYNVTRVNSDIIKKVVANLESEINTLDQFISGDIWMYNIYNPDGEEIESCGGYYGYGYTKEEVHYTIDNDIKYTEKIMGFNKISSLHNR